jgi:hypothetical protein
MAFVVGPSRGGKTTLLNRVLPAFPTAELLDLDAEGNRSVGLPLSGGAETGGWEGRWRRDETRLRDAANRSGAAHILVDVGAGSLQTPEGRQYFIDRGPHTIAVVAPSTSSWAVTLVAIERSSAAPSALRRGKLSTKRRDFKWTQVLMLRHQWQHSGTPCVNLWRAPDNNEMHLTSGPVDELAPACR